MPGAKRKLENFDPNKSDSNDDDFEPGESRPRKSAKKSRSTGRKKSTSKRKSRKHKGSDISHDEDIDTGISDESLAISTGEEDEEEPEMNPQTGRAVRKVAKKSVGYAEDSTSDVADLVGEDSEEPVQTKRRGSKRSRVAETEGESEEKEAKQSNKYRKTKIIKLKAIPKTTRLTRAGSQARSTRAGTSAEPLSAGLPPNRRSTRARTEEGEEYVALSASGRHAVRASRSPEPINRPTRSRKQPASTIKEIHETSSYEKPEGQGENTMLTEIIGTNEQDEDLAEKSDAPADAPGDNEEIDELAMPENEAHIQVVEGNDGDDEEEEAPVTRRTRVSRGSAAEVHNVETEDEPVTAGGRRLRKRDAKKSAKEQSSDFEPMEEPSEDELSGSDSKARKSKSGDDTSPVRRGRNPRAKSKSNSRKRSSVESDVELELDQDELADELQELKAGTRRRRARHDMDILYETKGRRSRKPVDYSIKPMDQIFAADEDAVNAAPSPTRRPRGGRNGASQIWERNLYSTYGPFGGGGGPAPVIGGPWGTGAIGGVDSDSSDDENMHRPNIGIGGNVGMTPKNANMPPGLLPGLGQTANTEAFAAMAGTPANVGKIKSQKALADADPLGIDQNVDFSKVGGLEGHIDQLKEMVQMPLLYPELFQKFHVTPPRGVLFHGPPGTGKTLLARALAATVSSGGPKITFYMRKGADALSKWVGEAERQLRLLFEEARKNQPSIIFFDEIDGLAPVRSSKQEQIHASIVSTLLALMDGMDGRGQVIVIGATNRPDNIDPALRRPGRFDREFYFPLPDIDGRKSIINIHTKDWGLDDKFKESLAHVTKGYGGADLRALCTEAALNAIQRTYPQIYSSNEKLIVNPDNIKITAKDFMLSVKKMVSSSERSTSSGAASLPANIEPLLRDQLKKLEEILDQLIPIKKKTTALQEAMYEQLEDNNQGFERETMQQEFEKSRVYRPRLLICGEPGMGQAYLGSALLNHFEGLHVQSFDLPTIYNDSARSPEAAIIQLFAEVKRHKPSVIFLPGIETWYHTIPESVITTFLGLLKAIPPTDPVLVLGICDSPPDKVSQDMLRDFFGYSKKNRFTIERPSQQHRAEFFQTIQTYAAKRPHEFPEPLNRKKRKLEQLEVAPPPPIKPPTKEEIKAQKKRDHQLLNLLKIQIQPIMDQIQKTYKKFRNPVIPQNQIQYLYDELDPQFVRPDIPQIRPFELDTDKEGVKGLRETSTGKFFYNLETTTIEERLSNGFYARPKDFLVDIKSLAKDSRNIGDKDRTLRANELLANTEVDLAGIEANPIFADCENLYQRQLQRAKEKEEKHRKKIAEAVRFDSLVHSDIPTETQESGPLVLGEAVPAHNLLQLVTPSKGARSNGMSNGARSDGEDVQMGGTDDDNTQKTAMQPPHISGRSNPSLMTTGANTQISQHSAFQEVPHGVSPKDMINDASTTTSGKKTSDAWSTQATNGIHSSPPQVRPARDSQLADTQQSSQNQHREMPDTQASSQYQSSQHRESQQGSGDRDTSSDEWAHSQAQALSRGVLQQPSQTPSSGSQSQPPVPAFDAPATKSSHTYSNNTAPSGLAKLLNSPSDEEATRHPHSASSSQQLSSQSQASADNFLGTDLLHNNLVRRFTEGSSGCSIEQLEQIYRELMVQVYNMRGVVNRDTVALKLIDVFNETVQDIEEMQKVLAPSQPIGREGASSI